MGIQITNEPEDKESFFQKLQENIAVTLDNRKQICGKEWC